MLLATANGSQNSPTGAATYRPSKLTPTGLRNRRATASRLSRNGRDWHHLLELCGLVEARVIDLDGVYDPCRPNDRLLLGMKGSISEFELGILRTRMLDAARAKARRGELRLSVPIGYIWHREYGLGLDPDIRVQEAIRLIFSRFRELGSARQVLISLTADNFHFPRPSDGRKTVCFDWVPLRRNSSSSRVSSEVSQRQKIPFPGQR
ncbi:MULTISPECIES: recombinase family protein [Sphingobium]|uniref:recombinase family protein n=1 Tax=Sphingobium sp. TaxID=1912891 RepID=UPI0021D2D72C|nr:MULTISPECIES: recombinase family protein [Sphingobium]